MNEEGGDIDGNREARFAADALAAAVVGTYVIGSGLLDSPRSNSAVLNAMAAASAGSGSCEVRDVCRESGLE
jgi:hypothetical protein